MAEERDMDIINGNVEAIIESVNKNGSKQYQICVRDSMEDSPSFIFFRV